METNEVLDRLPRHLHNLIIDQPYHNYTAQDHAIWRHIMRQNVKYLPGVAHSSYLQGLQSTGIGIEKIPEMYGMNRILKKIGWAAVAVDGFIPPAAFMEFQAYNVLVIAADIRPIDQLLYTPAPDIIHEAAGHAPIIADPEYSDYLRDFGKAGTLAFSSAFDNKVYEAIRHLSILKADPYTTFVAIEEAESQLDSLTRFQESPSEMALLRNLHWWTVEYGLIGTLENPKIYGAGLLSSIGESHNCLKSKVKKIPYSLDATNYSFDITTQQPQLFVTPDFGHLNTVLRQYLSTMAVNKGGMEGLKKALQSGTTSTIVYSSGLQVSGTLKRIVEKGNQPVYLNFDGPAMLSCNNHQIVGQGISNHKHGFGSPAGKIKNAGMPVELMSEGELATIGIVTGKSLSIEFSSGVQVQGRLERITKNQGRNLIFTIHDCTITYNGETLFDPAWGIYDMAVGDSVISAFSGPADPDAFELTYPAPEEKTHHIEHSQSAERLYELYSKVRSIREMGKMNMELIGIWNILKNQYPEEWLLPLEIAEELIKHDYSSGTVEEIVAFLQKLAGTDEEKQSLIEDGLHLIKND